MLENSKFNFTFGIVTTLTCFKIQKVQKVKQYKLAVHPCPRHPALSSKATDVTSSLTSFERLSVSTQQLQTEAGFLPFITGRSPTAHTDPLGSHDFFYPNNLRREASQYLHFMDEKTEHREIK